MKSFFADYDAHFLTENELYIYLLSIINLNNYQEIINKLRYRKLLTKFTIWVQDIDLDDKFFLGGSEIEIDTPSIIEIINVFKKQVEI